jgi:hypothetical protein
MTATDPKVQAAYRALEAALKAAAAPPVTRDELTEMYRQGKYAQIDEMRQDGRLDHILNTEG